MRPTGSTSPALILVVDDSPDILRVLGEVLAPTYRVRVANGGHRALQLLALGERPDLVLLDVQMPDLDGYAVLARMQADEAQSTIPVIFLTAMDNTAAEEHGFELGAADYIAKPIRPSIVRARVRAQLDVKRARDLLRDQNALLEVELARRAAENELILRAAGEGIYGIDMQGQISFVNPAAAAMLGYAAGELLGKPSHETIHHHYPDGRVYPREDCPIFTTQRTGQPYRSARDTFWRKDNSPIPVEYTVMPIERDQTRVGLVVCFTDISDRLRYQEQLERRSNFDELTGLPNRNLLQDRLTQSLGQCEHEGEELAVMLISLNRFKDINDTLGRRCGDELLRQLAQRLQAALPEVTTLARLDGDEFVLLQRQSTHRSLHLPQQVLDCFALGFPQAGHEVYMSAGLGVAVYPRDGRDVETLLRNASAAAYRAKSGGEGRLCYYSADMNARSMELLEMAADLRHAVERGELHLHYQPQVELHSGRIIGVEALLRWRHPRLGPISPAVFVPLAESIGIIAPMGEWVLREACRQNRAWRVQGLPPITVAVNLSVRQFESQDVIAVTRHALEDSGLPPKGLELELTEGAVMADAEAFVRATLELKQLGVAVSIDDFGTGFSSLSHLQRLTLDRLKIDQSFVRGLATHPDSAAIAQAIISLGHALRLSVIAEGVEEAEQATLLYGWGCDEVQGYFYSRPLPPQEVAALLAAGAMWSPAQEGVTASP